MANTYEFLLRRKADLEVRMIEAQRRAQEPFEGELKAIGVALGALEEVRNHRLGGGLAANAFVGAHAILAGLGERHGR